MADRHAASQRRASSAFGMQAINVACRESLAGREVDAVEHLRRAIAMWEGCRDMAKEETDFDPIREEPTLQQLIRR